MGFVPENKEIKTIAQAREMNPLVLAYIGDAVHSLYSRMKFSMQSTLKAHAIHMQVSDEVKAKSQASKMLSIKNSLTDEELGIYHRARNSHVNNIAKNASVTEYLEVTGYEAVIGFLYITGQNDRLLEILGND